MARITMQFLGTGSAWSKKYGNTSVLVTVENSGVEKKILIDCGRTTPDDLYKAGYTWNDIDAIFITHLHGDHVYGLEEAGFYGRYVPNAKTPHLILPDEKFKTDLWDRVLKGTMMQGDLDRQMHMGDYFTYDIVNRGTAFFEFNDVMFSVYPTEHIKNKKSFGLIIGERNYVVYSADSLFNRDLIKIIVEDEAQVIFHDCQFTDYKGKVHASLDELLSLEQNEREKIYIMHYGDNLEDYYLRIKDAGLRIAVPREKYEYIVD